MAFVNKNSTNSTDMDFKKFEENLTHISMVDLSAWTNAVAPDVTPQNAASNLGLMILFAYRTFIEKKICSMFSWMFPLQVLYASVAIPEAN